MLEHTRLFVGIDWGTETHSRLCSELRRSDRGGPQGPTQRAEESTPLSPQAALSRDFTYLRVYRLSCPYRNLENPPAWNEPNNFTRVRLLF